MVGFEIVQDTPTSDEAHWIVALLNANKTKTGNVAPYSPAEVIELYKGPDKFGRPRLFQGLHGDADGLTVRAHER